MKINIYQINHERDDKRLMFFGLDEVQKLTGSKMVKAEIYDKIFSGDVDCHSLEDVYRKFNEDHPAGYKGRSLSVSDVVEMACITIPILILSDLPITILTSSKKRVCRTGIN